MPKVTFQGKVDKLHKEYREVYDLENINSANDNSNLQSLLRGQVLVEELQEKVNELIEKGVAENITEIKKLLDSSKDIIDRNLALERALAIDRKSRKAEVNKDNPAEYINALKVLAREFIEKKLVKIYCPNCKILVGRVSAVHEHTKYFAEFQCSQCNKMATVKRQERDVLFDLKPNDRDWRRKHPVEIVQAKRKHSADLSKLDGIEDDIVIGDEQEDDTIE